MNIVILQDYLRSGGTERQSVLLARFLHLSGYSIHFITFRPGGPIQDCLGDVRHEALQKFDTGRDWFAPGLVKKLRGLNPNCILCFGNVVTYYAGWIQKKLPAVKVICGLRTGKSLSVLQWWSLRRVSHIIANCHWWKATLFRQGISQTRVSVVHNPLLFDRKSFPWRQRRKEIRTRFNISEDCCVFICVQNFRPQKRQIDLIRNFIEVQSRKNWQLWFVGDGKSLKECRQAVCRAGFEDSIRFFGYQSDPMEYYAGADSAISFSREDSLPNFLIEAQAMGLPVIARDYRGVKEAFIPNRTGFLLAENRVKKNFHQVVHCLIEKAHLRKEMGKRAQEHAFRNFAQSKGLSKTLELVKSMIHSKEDAGACIVLSRPDRVGDVVITTSCISSIKKAFPITKIYMIVRKDIVPLIDQNPNLEGVLPFADHQQAFHYLLHELKRLKPFCIVHLHHNDTVQKAAEQAEIPQRIGFSTKQKHSGLNWRCVDRKKKCEKHEAEYNFELLHLLGVPKPENVQPSINLNPEALRSLRSKCPWVEQSVPYGVLHLTAHGHKSTLPLNLFHKVACWLHRSWGVRIILLGNETDRRNRPVISEQIWDQPWIFDTRGQLNLAELGWLLKGARIAFGRDSGICHLAASLGTPTLTVVIPLGRKLAAKRWRPLGLKARHLEKQILPKFYESTSQYHRRYIQSIRFEDIQPELEKLMNT